MSMSIDGQAQGAKDYKAFIGAVALAQERGITDEELGLRVTDKTLAEIYQYILNSNDKNYLSKFSHDKQEMLKKHAQAIQNLKFGETHRIPKEDMQTDPRSPLRTIEIVRSDDGTFKLMVLLKSKPIDYTGDPSQKLKLPKIAGSFKTAGKPAWDVLTQEKYMQLMYKPNQFYQNATQIEQAARNEIFFQSKFKSPYIDHPEVGTPFVDKKGVPKLSFYSKFARGGTLSHFLKTEDGKNLKIQHAIIRQLLDVIKVIHEGNVVHQDLKPDNILVDITEDGSVKIRLSDFGVAAPEGEGNLGGTPQYISPESMKDFPRLPRKKNDMWALGVIIWEMRHPGERLDHYLYRQNLTIDNLKHVDITHPSFRDKFENDPLIKALLNPQELRFSIHEAIEIFELQLKNSKEAESTYQNILTEKEKDFSTYAQIGLDRVKQHLKTLKKPDEYLLEAENFNQLFSDKASSNSRFIKSEVIDYLINLIAKQKDSQDAQDKLIRIVLQGGKLDNRSSLDEILKRKDFKLSEFFNRLLKSLRVNFPADKDLKDAFHARIGNHLQYELIERYINNKLDFDSVKILLEMESPDLQLYLNQLVHDYATKGEKDSVIKLLSLGADPNFRQDISSKLKTLRERAQDKRQYPKGRTLLEHLKVVRPKGYKEIKQIIKEHLAAEKKRAKTGEAIFPGYQAQKLLEEKPSAKKYSDKSSLLDRFRKKK